MEARTKLHFARYEFKYLLPLALRREVESELRYFVDYDPFVASCENHRYFVRSLYFDDPSCSAFYDKVDGLLSRSKFRLRTYTNELNEDVPRFLEIKGRHNNLVYKHRTPLAGSRHDNDSDIDKLILSQAENSKVKDQFEYALYRKALQPVAVVDYERRPYISKYDPEFRLTFDEKLRGTLSNKLFPSKMDTARDLLVGYTVMEVKFRYHIPSWFHRIIMSYELRRVSISKICEAMQVLKVAEDL